MKKLLFLLLLPFMAVAQVSTGQEQEFDYGIKNNSSQQILTPDSLVTRGSDGTYGHVLSAMNQNAQTGVTSFDGLAVNIDPTKYDIGAGVGYISNPQTGEVKKITWSEQTAQTTPYLATSVATYVLKDDAGATVMQNSYPTPAQFRTHIYLGKLAHTTFTTILFAVTEPNRAYHVAGDLHDLVNTFGSLNRSGNTITPNGANLQINVSAGETYREGANFTANTNSPNITNEPAVNATSFRNKFRNGSGGWTAVNTTTVDPNYYDNGSGILQLVPNNKWTIKVVYRFGGTGTIHMDYGQAVYDNLTAADAGISNSVSSDPDTKNFASRIGWILIQQGTTSLLDATKYKFVPADKIGERAASATGTTTMQGAYNNSVTPQIVTTTTGGALAIKRGSAADTDNVLTVQNGAGSNTFTVDGNGNATVSTPTASNHAVTKAYADGLVVGLLNDRGSYDASTNLYPATGGSGTAGSILKGNLWAVSVAGTLGGVSVGVGDWIRALVDSPGQTASNWGVVEGNFGYVPANNANVIHLSGNETFNGTKTGTNGSGKQVALLGTNGSLEASTSYTNTTPAIYAFTSNTQPIIKSIISGAGTGDFFNCLGSDALVKSKIDYLGNITGTSFIKSGGTSSQFLKADGSVDSNSYATGTLTSGYIPKATGVNSLGNSLIYDDGTNVGIGINNPLTKLGIKGSLTFGVAGTDNLFQIGDSSQGSIFGVNQGLFINQTQDASTNGYYTLGVGDTGNHTFNLRFNVNNIDVLTLNRNGNVLIGKTTDDGVDKLQVNGTVSSGNITLGTSQPTANNQLTRKDYVDTALALKANLASPTFTGTPTAPTPTAGMGIANKDYVDSAVSAVGASSGTYTPTFTNVANISSTSFSNAYYSKIGNIVTVTVGLNITPSAANTNTSLKIDLPFSRGNSNSYNVGVSALVDSPNFFSGVVQTSSDTTTATLYFYPTTTGTYTTVISFQYSL